MKKGFPEYYLGLDIGTNSVGWAVTDENYNVLNFNRKSMWGIRLFDEANTAEERRVFRSARRRGDRKKYRLSLLRELFGEEISKVDENFFRRLDDSFYLQEDKGINQKNTLFNDEKFDDIKYHEKYPTIYHLRKELIEKDKKIDIRLIFLAINHILKKRGHFLYEGQEFSVGESLDNLVDGFLNDIEDQLGIKLELSSKEEFIKIIKDRNLNITNKSKKLRELIGVGSKDKQEKAVLELLAGGKVKLDILFNDESLKEEDIKDVKLSENTFEDKRAGLEELLKDRFYIIDKAKAIYDITILEEILSDEKYISFGKVKFYKEHKEDLKKLKDYIRNYGKKYFNEIFREVKKGNYASYVKNFKSVKNHSEDKNCTKDDFYKYIKKILISLEDNEDRKYILEKIEKETFLPLQATSDNAVIPYQLNKMELECILENTSKYYSFIDEKDEDGISTREKIISLLTFRIPYYVGPLNGYHKDTGFAWIEKKENEKIYPWNFDKVVDTEKSGEAFIKKMTNKCTYVLGEDVLPRYSLLYSEYTVLNEINKLKINGEPIDINIKNELVEKLFKTQKRISINNIKNYLLKNNYITKADTLSGVDINLSSTLSSYIDLKKIIGDKVENKKLCEDLILYRTLYEDKKLFEKRIKSEFKDILTKEEVKKLKELRFTGWGRLSEKLLTGFEGENSTENTTGEITNIINFLRESNDNLMEILSAKYTIYKKIEEYNKNYMEEMGIVSEGNINYKLVDELYLSPKVKRSTWQTLKIVKEIKKIIGKDPKKIFIEVAREEGEKARTSSRKEQLKALYKNCEKDKEYLLKQIDKKEEKDFKSKRLFLYYLQMGKCMYSGESIDISDIYKDNLYDIDHIYPQSITKDNSLNNMVLVKRIKNAEKGDKYPIDKSIQQSQRGFWYILKEKKFISEEKFNRLSRTIDLTPDEKAKFIARQIVETRQSSKAVADILKSIFKDSKIVYVKAGNVSDFRQEFKIYKNRDINDYHHGKDAYLNIVVGNVYNTKFTDSPINFIKDAKYREYNLKRLFEFNVERNGNIAWKVDNNKSITTVKNQVGKNNLQYTRLSFEQKGGLFDQTLMKKGNGQFPIKKSDSRLASIDKYGGYNKVKGAYFSLLEYKKGKKIIRALEVVPIFVKEELKYNKNALGEYFESKGIENPKVIIEKIKFSTLFQIDGLKCHIAGRTGEGLVYRNAIQLIINKEDEEYLRKISKYLQKKQNNDGLKIGEFDGINKEGNLRIFDIFIEKLTNSIYSIQLFKGYGNTLKDKRGYFESLELEEQVNVLNEILKFFQANRVNSNLKALDMGGTLGNIKFNKNIINNKSVYTINQSITGLFEEKVDLLKG